MTAIVILLLLLLTVPAQAQPSPIHSSQNFNAIMTNVPSAGMIPVATGKSTALWQASGIAGNPGGVFGSIQFNSAGSFGGFTMSGDCSINVNTGAITCTKLNGVTPGGSCSGTTPFLGQLSSQAVGSCAANTVTPQFGALALLGYPTSSLPACTNLSPRFETFVTDATQCVNATTPISGAPAVTCRAICNGPDGMGWLEESPTSGGGSVTTINTGAGLTGGPITLSGTISLVAPVLASLGGSGLISPTAHSLLQSEGAGAFGLLTASTAGNIVIDQGSGLDWASRILNKDCTITATGAITCTKTNGVNFATSATTDTTNATNIVSGTLAAGRMPLGLTAAPAAGQLPIGNAGGTAYVATSVNGDATLASTGALTVTETGGVSFAPSATTDTTNASNISTGTLNTLRLPTPFTSGTRSGNTSKFGTVSGATVIGDCVKFDASGNLVDNGTACAGSATPGGTSGQLEYNNVGAFGGFTVGGDGTLVPSTGILTVTKTAGTAFATSATTDTTNATNITSGTLGGAEGGSGVASPTAHSLLMGEGASPFNLITATTSGKIIIDQGSGVDFAEEALSKDCTITNLGVITCTKTNNVAFAPSATTDTTIASNITSGTLPAARMPLGITAIPAAGNILAGNAGGTAYANVAVSGDATLASTGALTVTKTSGVSFATSATTDTTNASNISTGTLATTLLPAPFTSGTRSGNTGAFVTTTGVHTSGNCTKWDVNGNAVDSGAPCAGSGAPGGGSGQVQYNNAGSFAGFTVGGDATLNTSTGALTVTKTSGVAFAPSATTDTTNAANIASGTLLPIRGGSGVSSPTAHSLLQGEGASAFGAITAATAGNIVVDQGAGSDWLSVALSKDCTIAATGAITCTKTNNVAFAASATTDTTVASNIASGTLSAGRLPALTGDTTTSAGSAVTTTGKVNGVAYPSGPAVHQVPVVTASNVVTYKTVPDCQTTGGTLALNYTQSSDTFSCNAVSGGGGGGGPTISVTHIVGTSGGDAYCWEPWQTVGYMEVRCKLISYLNTTATPQTYTYTTAFNDAGYFVTNVVGLASASKTTLTLPASMISSDGTTAQPAWIEVHAD